MNRVKDKVAIITGAGSGMGRADAIALAEEGARIVATDRNVDGGNETVARIRSAGGQAIFVEHDVADENQWRTVVQQCVQRFGNASILVNNAGVFATKPVTEMSLEEWDFILNTNLRGTFLGCRETVPMMKQAGGGSIINISSIMGIVARADFSAYCASKGGIRLFTKALAAELAPFRIRANTIHPGAIETAMIKHFLGDQSGIDMVLGSQPIRRIGRPEEVAASVLFLASDESAYITGTELVIDGGYVAV